MVIRWLNPYGTDWHYAVSLPNGGVWTSESFERCVDMVVACDLTREAISFVRK